MKKKVKTSLIGLGYWGVNYLRVLSQLETVNIAYVCEKSIERLQKCPKSLNAARTTDYHKVARDETVEAVIVSTPASTHYEVSKAMLEAGKHVLVEKPLTLDYSEAKDLVRIAKEEDVTLMVGHIYCFNSVVNAVRNIVDSGKLGNLFYGVGLRLGLGPIRNDASCTWDLATHDIAILDYLVGKNPSLVSAQASSFLRKESDILDYSTILLTYENGFDFSLIVSWYAAEKIRTWYLMGSKRMIKFDDLSLAAPLTIYEKSALRDSRAQDSYSVPNEIFTRDGKTIMPFIQRKEPLVSEVGHFIDCVSNRQTPLTDGLQGARVVRVLEAIERSIANQGTACKVTET